MYVVKTSVNRGSIKKNNKKDVDLKFIVIGDSQIGKTRLVKCYCGCEQNENCGNNRLDRFYYRKKIIHKDWTCNLTIHDTAGQERYRSITSSYYRSTHGCLLLFDVSDEVSFRNLENWYNDAMRYCNEEDTTVNIVGINRGMKERTITRERAEKFAEHHNLPYHEVNINNQPQIEELFQNIASDIVEKIMSRHCASNTVSTVTSTNLSKLIIKAEAKCTCNCC